MSREHAGRALRRAGPGAPDSSPGPWDSPGFLLWRATLRWQRATTAALRPLGLTHVQFVLLAAVWWLSDHPETPSQPPSQRQVADHAGADVMMTSQVLRALEKRGLVIRTPDGTDTRIKRLTVTPAGRQLAPQAVTVVEAADAEFFDGVRDPTQVVGLLRELAGDRHLVLMTGEPLSEPALTRSGPR